MKILKNILTRILTKILLLSKEMDIFDVTTNYQRRYFERQKNHPNPFVRYGKQCFSQSDEDGLTVEIIKRLNLLKGGTFAEFGCGNGTENNTIILLALGWRGFWVDGRNLAVDTEQSDRLSYYKKWITKENIISIVAQAKQDMKISNLDVISLDVDGNDFHFCEELLRNNIKPKLFIVEYNAKFFPPIEFTIPYDSEHKWCGDNYQGASLTTLNNLFSEYDYKLVCCNAATGVNAFFVKNEYASKFPEVPKNIDEIYATPFLKLMRSGHKKSLKTINLIINQ